MFYSIAFQGLQLMRISQVRYIWRTLPHGSSSRAYSFTKQASSSVEARRPLILHHRLKMPRVSTENSANSRTRSLQRTGTRPLQHHTRTLHQRTTTPTHPRVDPAIHVRSQLGRLLQHNLSPNHRRTRSSNPGSSPETRSGESKRQNRGSLRRLFERSRRTIHNNNRCKSSDRSSTTPTQPLDCSKEYWWVNRSTRRPSQLCLRPLREILDSQLFDAILRTELFSVVRGTNPC